MGNDYARLGLTVGGAVIGAFFGPGGFAVGAMLGGMAGHLLFPIDDPKGAQQKAPGLNDLSIQVSTYGNAIPLPYGTVRIAGNVIWMSKLKYVRTEGADAGGDKKGEKKKDKKGGGAGGATTSVFASFAIAIAQGPILGIRRVWADDQLVFDFQNPKQIGTRLRIYKGDEAQVPDSTIEAEEGINKVPAYRGLAYIVFTDFKLDQFGGRLPNFHFEVVAGSGSEIGHVDILPSEPGLTWGGKIEIDLETGLVWLTHERANAIVAYTPDTLEEVHRIYAKQPRGITFVPEHYQPSGFSAVLVGPFMVVASSEIHLNGGTITSINTRTLQVHYESSVHPSNFGFGYSLYNLGEVQFNYPRLLNYNINFPPTVELFCSNAGASGYWHLPIFDEGAETPPTQGTNTFQALTHPVAPSHFVIADTDFLASPTLGHYVYILDWIGWIHRLHKDGHLLSSLRGVATQVNVDYQGLAVDHAAGGVYHHGYVPATGKSQIKKLKHDLSAVEWTAPELSSPEAYIGVGWHPLTQEVFAISREWVGFDLTLHVCKINKTTGERYDKFATDLEIGINWLSDFKIYPLSMYGFATLWAGAQSLRIPLVPFPVGDGPAVSAVLSDIATRTGLTAGQIDSASMTGNTVRGFVVAHRTPARNAIEPLMRAYQFDVLESDGKIEFKKRGTASVASIPYDDLGARDIGSTPEDPLLWRHAEEREIPLQVDVRYLDPHITNDADSTNQYKVSLQTARRVVGTSQQVVTVELALVLTESEAQQLAEMLLYSAYVERTSVTAKVSLKYLALDPGDVISVTDADGEVRTFRVVKTTFVPPNLVELELLQEETSIYTQYVNGVATTGGPQQSLTIIPTAHYLMDLPALSDGDDNAGIYSAVHGAFGTDWLSAEVYQSDTGNGGFVSLYKTQSQATAGSSLTTLTWEGAIL